MHPGNQNPIHQSTEDAEVVRLNAELADRILWMKGEGRFLAVLFAMEDKPGEPGKFQVSMYAQNRSFPMQDFNIAGRMFQKFLQGEVERMTGPAPEPVKIPEELPAEPGPAVCTMGEPPPAAPEPAPPVVGNRNNAAMEKMAAILEDVADLSSGPAIKVAWEGAKAWNDSMPQPLPLAELAKCWGQAQSKEAGRRRQDQ